MYKGFVREHSSFFLLIAKLSDGILFFLSGILAYYIYFGKIIVPFNYLIALIISFFLTVLIFPFHDVYKSYRGQRLYPHLKSVYSAIVVVALIFIVIAFITKNSAVFSRVWFLIWLFNVFILLTFFRIIVRQFLKIMRKRGWNQRTVIILGAGLVGCELVKRVKRMLWSGFKVLDLFDNDSRKIGNNINDIIIKNIPNNLSLYVDKYHVDEVWLTFSLNKQNEIKNILESLNDNIVTIRYFPNVKEIDIYQNSLVSILDMTAVNIIASPMIGINRFVKACEDRIISFIILFVISPIMLLIAIFIKLTSKGPIFYKQKRHGWDGKPIWIYKFRTMIVHKELEDQLTQAVLNDARITKIGKVLRKTSLDELPQFINVLQGYMSIVGPRPHAMVHNEHYKKLIPLYMQRHQVKPGITGWAQINGLRGETNILEKMERRVEFDLYYIKNWSLWFDLKIIFLTIFKGFINKNAY